jgi:hypothetical protein
MVKIRRKLMKYYRTYWEQSSLEYATWIFSEVDNQGYEIRKLEIFLDGKISYYDANIPFELGEFPTDEDLESINDSEEITVIEISKNDFEKTLQLFNDKNQTGGQ